MPSSRPNHIPTVLGIIQQLDPSSVLDIGVGFGKWGHLIREYTDIVKSEREPQRYKKDYWRVRIDGIEGFVDYLTPLHDYVYDTIFVGDMRKLIDERDVYDVILLADVIEHVEKEDGLELLCKCVAHCKKAVIVSTPSSFVPQGESCGNPLEVHRSRWTAEDFLEFDGARAKVTENEILVAVIPSVGLAAPAIAPPLRRKNRPLLARAIAAAKHKLRLGRS